MLIDYKNVKILHDDEDLVLENVDFEVEPGQLIYLIGKVGAGKSSLLRTIYGEIKIASGEKAIVLDKNMLKLKRKYLQPLRRELGIIFQDFKLLGDRSIYGNLEFVLRATGWKKKADRAQRISEVLRAVDLEGVEHKMPHELSGGEQQRIAIARALLNRPKMILADEPTGNLDPETADNILSLFKDIAAAGTAVIISTHNHTFLDKYPGVVYQFEDNHCTKNEQ